MLQMMIALALFLAVVVPIPTDAAGTGERPIGNDVAGPMRNTTAPPVLRERYDYYEVCGCCEKDLQCDLAKKCVGSNAGKKYDSMTDWKLKWDYGRSRGPALCAADSFTVTVYITFHLPKWARAADAPQALMDKWEKYEESLLVHEKQHEELAIDAAIELTHAVGELPSARTCDELDRNVRRLAEERSRRLTEDQKAYDKATNHGVTQGAVFP